jgi:acyl-CoA thioesterase-2
MTSPVPSPVQLVDELVQLLQIDAVGDNRFVGQSQSLGNTSVFGGQVLGQALAAACRTVDADRPVHSLHAYFLLPGDFVPIEYEVDSERDGRSFSTRHVVARQEGRTIFELSASFQTRAQGIEHQLQMPEAPAPESLLNDPDHNRAFVDRLPEPWRSKAVEPRPIEYRIVDPLDPVTPERRPAQKMIWLRAAAPLPDDPILHRALLAYASDYAFIGTALLPHQLSFYSGRVRMASLDHAMWFHRDFRMDDWLLYCMDSPNANGARGFARGSLFTRDGRLVASTAQEGMIRVVA